MSEASSTHHPESRPKLSVAIARALKRYFVTGLATIFPVVLTVWLLFQIFRIADRFLGQYFGWQIPGLGLLVTCLIILAVGVFSIHLFGRILFQAVEVWFGRIPFVKNIYPAVKQIALFLFTEEGQSASYKRVVLTQFPRLGCYAIAFVTNEDTSTITGKEETILTLLVPNPPSPFSGPVLFVPKHDVIPIDMSVEDALKLIVSGGVVGTPLRLTEVASNKRTLPDA